MYTNSWYPESTPFLHDKVIQSIQAAFFGRGTELSLGTAYHTNDIFTTCNGALISWVCGVMHDKISQKGLGSSSTFEMTRGMGMYLLT